MNLIAESGVLAPSERFFSTPSAIARRLFFYVTRCGHYYLDTDYDFRHTSEVGQEESHRNFLLVYIRRGAMHFVSDNRQETGIQGQCALLDCRRPHRYCALEDTEDVWVHFDGANANAFFEQIRAQNSGRLVLTPTPESRIEREIVQLVSSMRAEKTPWSEVDCSQTLYRILCALLIPPLSEQHQADHPVSQAMHYIHANLFTALSVDQVAAAVRLSPSHFSRLFRAHTGFSPHEYIILHRIDEAKALLHGTALSVKEIAFRVGYRSEVNFITAFKRKTGMSPTAFRNMPV